jgi:trans-2,3-dihydro-3-hydroxyanthranilate isomerase
MWVSLYESFAERPFGGNMAGVVVTPHQLDNSVMQGLASDLMSPTTGFIDTSSICDGIVPVRFFTPTQEIDACGHVTIAVVQALHDLGLQSSEFETEVKCRGGTFRVSKRNGELSMHQTALTEPQPYDGEIAELERILSTKVRKADIAGTGLRHLFAEVETLEALAELTLNHSRLASLGNSLGVDTIGVYFRSGHDRVRLRDLTAPIGVLEEPASGTTSGALGLLLQVPRLYVEQGFEMGRPSLITVEVAYPRITVSGTTRQVFVGTFIHPDQQYQPQ